ncbi:MAG: hypothetical protein CMI25_04505 [Opitutae bacterium]|nr:hypothetical protein [Opitutae bacterium]
MIDYWLHLTPTMKMFVGIGTVSSAVLTLQMVLAMFGGDMDGLETDVDIPDAGEGGASGILSIRTIGAFFTGFGWSGAAMLQAGYGTGAATFVGIVVGSIFMALIFYLMTYLHSLRQEGTINYANAVGKIGSVYLPIPPHRKGIGQVEVLVQGRLKIVQAITDNDKKIGNRVAVRVTELVDTQTILVEPLENESPKES